MKITPLAVWAQNLTEQGVSDAVKKDVEIIHSEDLMAQIVTTYCLAIQFLIKNPSDKERAQNAFEVAREYALK